MWKLFWLFVLCSQRFVEASPTLCDSPQSYLEVEEGKQNSTFVCSGLKQEENVQWSLEFPGWIRYFLHIGTCFTNLSCIFSFKSVFHISRTTETSVFIFNETAIVNKTNFPTVNLLCRTYLQGSETDESRCQVDYVYPAENISCKIEFSGKLWSLTGQCATSKVYSKRNNYGCYLYQNLEGSQESTRVVGFYRMDLGPSTADKYVSGSCNLTSFLPPNGRYSYSVVILPGKVKVPAMFNGNNTIRQPPVSPTHNCPLFVKEGETVNCKCSVDDYGSPPGKLTWNTGSDQLLLTGVKKEQHGMTFVCGVMWNNTVFQTVNYTLLIACKPRRTDASSTPPTVVEGKTTSFELIAYPNCLTVTKYFMGSNNNKKETPASDDIFSVVCSPNPQLLYKVTCTVMVIKVTVNTAGLYKAVVSNDLGSVALIFEALPPNMTG